MTNSKNLTPDINKHTDEKPAGSNQAYAWYIVALCMIAYIFSFIDRQILALLIEPIRADLKISDTQFSLLHGLAFSLFYATMGIPIARLADSRSRPAIIAAGIFLWSLATALTGFGKTFWQVFVARMGVGVGEAALSPAVYSMITDLFSKSQLGRALAVYSIGSFIGAGLAFLIGGAVVGLIGQAESIMLPLIGATRPWQIAFFLVGAPGILLAAVVGLTVKDPVRRHHHSRSKASFTKTLEFIRSNTKFFMGHYGGFTLCAMALYGLMSWMPAFLIRHHDVTTAEAGLILGFILLFANVGGVLASGFLTDYFVNKGQEDGPMRAGMVGAIGLAPPTLLFAFMPSLTLALPVITLAFFFASFPLATAAAAMQVASPPQMRAQVTAIFLLFNNLIGLAVGTTLIALITDNIFKNDTMVGFSVSIVSGAAAIGGAVVLNMGRKPYVELAHATAAGP